MMTILALNLIVTALTIQQKKYSPTLTMDPLSPPQAESDACDDAPRFVA